MGKKQNRFTSRDIVLSHAGIGGALGAAHGAGSGSGIGTGALKGAAVGTGLAGAGLAGMHAARRGHVTKSSKKLSKGRQVLRSVGGHLTGGALGAAAGAGVAGMGAGVGVLNDDKETMQSGAVVGATLGGVAGGEYIRERTARKYTGVDSVLKQRKGTKRIGSRRFKKKRTVYVLRKK